jgi:hypothetical protein
LPQMFFEGRPQFFALSRLGHFRQGLCNLSLGVKNIFKFM